MILPLQGSVRINCKERAFIICLRSDIDGIILVYRRARPKNLRTLFLSPRQSKRYPGCRGLRLPALHLNQGCIPILFGDRCRSCRKRCCHLGVHATGWMSQCIYGYPLRWADCSSIPIHRQSLECQEFHPDRPSHRWDCIRKNKKGVIYTFLFSRSLRRRSTVRGAEPS